MVEQAEARRDRTAGRIEEVEAELKPATARTR